MQPTANGLKGPTDWNTVNWRDANRHVRNLRRRIFRATQQGDWKRVHSLQKLMLRSYSNRLLAVRRVTQVNQGKRTPGVDKVLVKTPKARGTLVDELGNYTPWRAKPTKRVYIPKASGKLRPLGIPTIRDRALQAMVKNALEPSWEARFEATSYGFRPGRSCHDAIARLYLTLNSRQGNRCWIVDADIEGAFDNIDHAFLLHTIGNVPGRALIRQWLKAGYLEGFVWHPTDAGTPQGGVISPLLANIALHGMEEAVGVVRRYYTSGTHVLSSCTVVRYADDFVVCCKTQEDAEQAIDRLTPWLAKRGLTLSREKTRIVHIRDGFDFLGFNLRMYNATATHKSGAALLIKPSRDSVSRLRARLRDEWHSLQGHSVQQVTQRLNPIIRGWANYYRIGVASHTFTALDNWMFHREVRYVKRQHPKKPWHWCKNRYWGPHHNARPGDRWVFGNSQTRTILRKFRWTLISRHIQVKGMASPDDPSLQQYWLNRQRHHGRMLPPSQQRLAQQQGYLCEQCGDSLLNGEELHIHHEHWRSRGGTDAYDNLKLRHLYCHQQIHAHSHESREC